MKREEFKQHKVRTLDKCVQFARNYCASFDMTDGAIELGCDEDHAPTIIWHEFMHKIFFEEFDFESTKYWDDIADDLQHYLFDITTQILPYIYIAPPITAKPIPESHDKWLNGKKDIKKSIRVGYTPDSKYKRKIPIRHPTE